jgi:hypothetical protein
MNRSLLATVLFVATAGVAGSFYTCRVHLAHLLQFAACLED